MRSWPRTLIRVGVVAIIAVALLPPAARPSAATAAEGDPGDACSQAPDFPLAWDFNDACRGHDECIEDLGRGSRMLERLECDATFLGDLLEARHPVAPVACGEHLFCRAVAGIYYHVVRYATVLGGLLGPPPDSALRP